MYSVIYCSLLRKLYVPFQNCILIKLIYIIKILQTSLDYLLLKYVIKYTVIKTDISISIITYTKNYKSITLYCIKGKTNMCQYMT